ncbi:hypothetical protein EB796_007609 [Bugula neritina]|uniref:Uncharacterized protein n=1 Tax=Bugula neritina TaxID=10212 RepID=A0A7J7JTL6_BUGNE|nr:hypothetical protein EB796_011969 [Bugula neritina]KAF6034084.1 hypothetical protein EB796_007609 [Bugula neritina]
MTTNSCCRGSVLQYSPSCYKLLHFYLSQVESLLCRVELASSVILCCYAVGLSVHCVVSAVLTLVVLKHT